MSVHSFFSGLYIELNKLNVTLCLGFHKYFITNVGDEDPSGSHQYKVFLCSDPQNTKSTALVKECKTNPFKQVNSAFLKIDDGVITGIMIEDDWVEMV